MMKRKRKVEENFEEDIKELLVCKYCTYETENIDDLDNHILTHELEDDCDDMILSVDETPPEKKPKENPPEVYSCPCCKYTTKRKHDLPKHLLTHTAPDATTVYRCSQCPYETKRKNDMPKHMLAHCTDVQMFKCPDCPYQTKRKSDLPKHLLCHKPCEEVPLYKCDYCVYVTKRKGDLPKHVLNHKDISNLKLYDCSECDYRTKRKNDLHKHMLVHCDRHVAGVFKCLKCTYATDKVNKFSKHALSDCTLCEDVITLEHLMLDDIIATVESDEVKFTEGSEEEEEEEEDGEENEYSEEYREEDAENEQEDYQAHQYIQHYTKGNNLENYQAAVDRRHGVFNITLGEFSVDAAANSQYETNREQVFLKQELEEGF